MIQLVEDTVSLTFQVLSTDIVSNPCHKMVFECFLDDLMKKVR